MKMGIIAEDDSDVSVMKEITLSLLKPHRIGFKHFVGNGHGKLQRKCADWAKILVLQGCPWIAIVHDLDKYDEILLRRKLTGAIAPARAKAKVVLLPKCEIESWLLYDADAIATAFNETQRPKLPGAPELLEDPKKHLRDLIWKKYRKVYLNTFHNKLIAKHINVSFLRRSSSFSPHLPFVNIVKRTLR
jgi:hypothetical protein